MDHIECATGLDECDRRLRQIAEISTKNSVTVSTPSQCHSSPCQCHSSLCQHHHVGGGDFRSGRVDISATIAVHSIAAAAAAAAAAVAAAAAAVVVGDDSLSPSDSLSCQSVAKLSHSGRPRPAPACPGRLITGAEFREQGGIP